MSAAVVYTRDADIGFIEVRNPPVNALSQAVRAGLVSVLRKASEDRAAKAIVVIGSGRTFIAGADIREFGKPSSNPTLREVIAAFEALEKPIIAALHGHALGGGLELALGCDFRVALQETLVGCPEVKLGLMPGAGGSQRLPRAVGIEMALDMITSGRFVSAAEARSKGLLDAVLSAPDVREAGKAFARKVIDEELKAAPLSGRSIKTKPDPASIRKWRNQISTKARGRMAPLKCLEAVIAAAELPFDEGMKRERELFEDCLNSPQRAALIHVFFGERAVAKVPGLPSETETRPVESVAILGAGTMGSGIAMCLADAGLAVTLVEANQDALERGLARIRGGYKASSERGRITSEDASHRLSQIKTSLEVSAVSTADLVIEAVFEDMGVKKKVFAELDYHAKPGAILATNTSYLDVNEIASATKRPGDVLGLHFFSPANVMRLLEVVRTAKTAPEVLASTLKLAKQIGKLAVVAQVGPGFIGNRMLKVYQRQAYYMIEDGALPWQVDAALVDFGFAMGPFAVGDLAGLDIGYANRRREDATRDPHERYVDVADKLHEMGRHGQKSGAGWYRYEDGSRNPEPDPLVEALILEASRSKGVVRRTFLPEEITTRALLALVNEGAFLLEEGVASRSVDIDMVWINGYGFPAHKGGPMYWAEARGLERTLAEIEVLAKDDPRTWQPAPLIKRLVREARSLADWNQEMK